MEIADEECEAIEVRLGPEQYDALVQMFPPNVQPQGDDTDGDDDEVVPD